MIYVFVASLLTVTFLAVLFFFRATYWKNKFLDTGFTIELELSTLDQIINELRNRPNCSFVILEPKQAKDGLTITTHACNMEPSVILTSLRAAYTGMAAHFGVDDKDDLGDEIEGDETP